MALKGESNAGDLLPIGGQCPRVGSTHVVTTLPHVGEGRSLELKKHKAQV